MDINDIFNLSTNLFKIICSKNDIQKPKLLTNIAFSEYNKDLNLDPTSPVAFLLTSNINDLIVRNFYNNVVEYEEPTKEYVANSEEYEIYKQGNLYEIEEHHKTHKFE